MEQLRYRKPISNRTTKIKPRHGFLPIPCRQSTFHTSYPINICTESIRMMETSPSTANEVPPRDTSERVSTDTHPDTMQAVCL
jgi:hypothetical protein